MIRYTNSAESLYANQNEAQGCLPDQPAPSPGAVLCPLGIELQPSRIPAAGTGTWASQLIPAGTMYGPYLGKEDLQAVDSGVVSDKWMGFVNRARCKEEQNVIAFQQDGCVYYQVIKDIPANEELLVWYDEVLGSILGINMSSDVTKDDCGIYTCRRCIQPFMYQNSLLWHKLHDFDCNAYTQLNVCCDGCGEEFDNKKKLKLHIMEHYTEMQLFLLFENAISSNIGEGATYNNNNNAYAMSSTALPPAVQNVPQMQSMAPNNVVQQNSLANNNIVQQQQLYRTRNNTNMVPNNMVPNNMALNNMAPNNMALNNMAPNNMVLNNMVPDNMVPSNMVPTNMVPRNIPPNNMVPNNLVPNNMVPNNMVSNNMAPNNMVPRNMVPNNSMVSMNPNSFSQDIESLSASQSKSIAINNVLAKYGILQQSDTGMNDMVDNGNNINALTNASRGNNINIFNSGNNVNNVNNINPVNNININMANNISVKNVMGHNSMMRNDTAENYTNRQVAQPHNQQSGNHPKLRIVTTASPNVLVTDQNTNQEPSKKQGAPDSLSKIAIERIREHSRKLGQVHQQHHHHKQQPRQVVEQHHKQQPRQIPEVHVNLQQLNQRKRRTPREQTASTSHEQQNNEQDIIEIDCKCNTVSIQHQNIVLVKEPETGSNMNTILDSLFTRVLPKQKNPCVCNVCGKKFATPWTLKEHSRVHTGDKPFQCDVCEKSFAHHSNMVRHYRIHTGERPYECPYCDKKFSVHSNLTAHYPTHVGIKQYSCGKCGKDFIHASSLHKHMKMHGHAGVVKKMSHDLKYVTTQLAQAQKRKQAKKQMNVILKMNDLMQTAKENERLETERLVNSIMEDIGMKL